MILTITINPLLERRFSFKNVNFGLENRDGKEEIKVGGKGINVSRQLNQLSTENFAFTFYGGNNGKLLKETLTKENIKFSSVRTNEETRECAVIIDESLKKIFTFFGPNTKVNKTEAEEFKLKLEKMIENCEIVIFSGSSPCSETDSIFPYGIQLANKYDKISVCDTYGKHLQNCLDNSPTIVHNNMNEIEKSLGVSLKGEEQKIEFLNSLYKKGIKQTYLTNGGDEIYASNFDFHFKIENPKINTVDPTGSGDSFVAGIAYGWHNNLTFNETIIIAAKLGIINASRFDVCNVAAGELETFSQEIKISPMGKKMKTLDVTPR